MISNSPNCWKYITQLIKHKNAIKTSLPKKVPCGLVVWLNPAIQFLIPLSLAGTRFQIVPLKLVFVKEDWSKSKEVTQRRTKICLLVTAVVSRPIPGFSISRKVFFWLDSGGPEASECNPYLPILDWFTKRFIKQPW